MSTKDKNPCAPAGSFPLLFPANGPGIPGPGIPGMGIPGMGIPGMGIPGMGIPGMGIRHRIPLQKGRSPNPLAKGTGNALLCPAGIGRKRRPRGAPGAFQALTGTDIGYKKRIVKKKIRKNWNKLRKVKDRTHSLRRGAEHDGTRQFITRRPNPSRHPDRAPASGGISARSIRQESGVQRPDSLYLAEQSSE